MTYYDLDGSPCSQDRAVELLQDLPARTVARTEMEIAGYKVLVSTIFTIADQAVEILYRPEGEQPPLLWITEVIGGPTDIDGTFQFAASRKDAFENHVFMVERMGASGCHVV